MNHLCPRTAMPQRVSNGLVASDTGSQSTAFEASFVVGHIKYGARLNRASEAVIWWVVTENIIQHSRYDAALFLSRMLWLTRLLFDDVFDIDQELHTCRVTSRRRNH